MARRNPTTPVDRSRAIRDLYRSHPLREESILKRLVAQKVTLAGITELDLAEDPTTEITDQNHVGGPQFVKDLARTAGVSASTDVLDLGCGLGGSARCLAYFFGCRVHGIDLSEERCREARHLTKLVGLDQLVTFQCGDVLKVAIPRRRFDVLWGQSAWVHIEDKEALITRWSETLPAGGRIALEEAYVKRPTRGAAERRSLEELSDLWKAYLVGLDTWIRILASQSFEVFVNKDLTEDLVSLYRKLSRRARTSRLAPVPRSEQRSWTLAVRMAEEGVVGYRRLVARKRADLTGVDPRADTSP